MTELAKNVSPSPHSRTRREATMLLLNAANVKILTIWGDFSIEFPPPRTHMHTLIQNMPSQKLSHCKSSATAKWLPSQNPYIMPVLSATQTCCSNTCHKTSSAISIRQSWGVGLWAGQLEEGEEEGTCILGVSHHQCLDFHWVGVVLALSHLSLLPSTSQAWKRSPLVSSRRPTILPRSLGMTPLWSAWAGSWNLACLWAVAVRGARRMGRRDLPSQMRPNNIMYGSNGSVRCKKKKKVL